jgi:dsRNA-specific ribonuclease
MPYKVSEVLSFVPLLIMHTWSFFSLFDVDTQLSLKNQLQVYCQKRGKQLPSYHPIQEGPVHSCQFKSIVTVDGHTFESPQFCRTLKEAETAAAKVALMSLPQEASLPEQSTVGPFLILSCLTNGAFS